MQDTLLAPSKQNFYLLRHLNISTATLGGRTLPTRYFYKQNNRDCNRFLSSYEWLLACLLTGRRWSLIKCRVMKSENQTCTMLMGNVIWLYAQCRFCNPETWALYLRVYSLSIDFTLWICQIGECFAEIALTMYSAIRKDSDSILWKMFRTTHFFSLLLCAWIRLSMARNRIGGPSHANCLPGSKTIQIFECWEFVIYFWKLGFVTKRPFI